MSEAPFHSFAFTLVENRQPRKSFKLTVSNPSEYELRIQKGSAANPSLDITRIVPLQVVERLRDSLQEIGVFGWDESYGDTSAPGSRRWSVSVVFKEDVFSVESRGGSDVPTGFDVLLEELYRLDFPRPAATKAAGGTRSVGSALNQMGVGKLGSVGGMNAGDMGAFAATGRGGVGDVDFAKLSEMMGGADMADMMAEMQRNPRAMEQRMKEEFRHMSPDEQRQLIDMLVKSGLGTREYWERFFRG